MGWVRLDDRITENPKLDEAGPTGSWLHVCAIAYCNRNLTDGLVHQRMVKRLGSFDWMNPETLMLPEILVRLGLWHEPGHSCEDCPQIPPGHFYVHDYTEFQPSREEIEARRAKDAERQRQHRERQNRDGEGRFMSRRDRHVTHEVTNDVTPANSAPIDHEDQEDDPSRRDTSVTNAVSHTVPNPTQPKRVISKEIPLSRADLVDTLLAVCNIDTDEVTASARRSYDKAAADLEAMVVTVDDIEDRAMAFRRKWPDAQITPQAIVRRWPELANPNLRVLRAFVEDGS